MARRAGILIHPTSLPGALGMGDIGPAATQFVDWAAEAGLRVWQVLPLGPPGGNHSPYSASSAFAGNPLLASVERLVTAGWISQADLDGAPPRGSGQVDFARELPFRADLLRRSWAGFRKHAGTEARRTLEAFVAHDDQSAWLADWTLFAALKRHHAGRSWTDWDSELARRTPSALRRARRELREEVAYQEYLQCLFYSHWRHLRRRAKQCGITLFGDLPFYVAHDSADVWAHRELFQLDDAGRPLKIAGVPPDYFSADGQVWGNPLFRWDRLAERGYDWWVARLAANLRQADVVRLDHFRAFAAYWEIDAGSRTAVGGRWVSGPGDALFDAARRHLGALPFIAEDLGDITPDVNALRDRLGLPGMRILQFGIADPDSEHHPSRHVAHSVVYTGTHDNDSVLGWYRSLDPDTRQRALAQLGATESEITPRMIEAAYASVAETCVVPLQDILGLGPESRMNLPGEGEGNWGWRTAGGALTLRLAEGLRRLAETHGRQG